MDISEFLQQELNNRKSKGLLRRLYPAIANKKGKIFTGKKWLYDFASNDYLGLAEQGLHINPTASGAKASRLLSGNRSSFQNAEKALAQRKKKQACLFFSSGYSANVSIIPAMLKEKDAAFLDKACHASIIDGVRLSNAKMLRFRHNDAGHLESIIRKNRHKFKNAMIITESLFSMDGDFAPLSKIKKIAREKDCWLYVDDAHSTGIWEINTKGIDILVGTFGKAFGLWGAYVCGSKKLIDYLTNFARGFVFSTALPPFFYDEIKYRIEYIKDHPQLITKLKENIDCFTKQLGGKHSSQIIPIILGETEQAVKLSRFLNRKGFFVPAIRPPTVPQKTARLRISITTHHNRIELEKLARLIRDKANG